MLVYRLPGPSTTRSAAAIASSAWGIARGSAGGQPDAQRQALAGGDRRLAGHALAALQLGVQGDALERRGQHPAAHVQHRGRFLHGALEVAGHVGQGGHEEVAEAVALQAAVLGKAILEEAAHERLVVGQGDEAAADVARRQHAEAVAQQAGAAAVVGDRDHRGQVARVFLEPREQHRQARAAADRHDPRAAGEARVAAQGEHALLAGRACEPIQAARARHDDREAGHEAARDRAPRPARRGP